MQTRPLLLRTNDFLLDGGIFFLFHLYLIHIILSPLSRSFRPAACPSVYHPLIHFMCTCVRNCRVRRATCRLIYTRIEPITTEILYRRTNPTGLMYLKYRGSGNCNRNLVRRSHTVPQTYTVTCIIHKGTIATIYIVKFNWPKTR